MEEINPLNSSPQPTPLSSQHSRAPTPKSGALPAGVKVNGESAYIDMGLVWSDVLSSMMDWYPTEEINQQRVNNYLDSITSALKKDGVTSITLSFAQLSDIDKLADTSGDGSSSDTITQMFKGDPNHPSPYLVGGTTKNFLSYLVDRTHDSGLKVGISFGGANASADDMTLQKNGTTEANTLADFMNAYNIDSADWDIEGGNVSALMANPDISTFFSVLHSRLSTEGKQSVLTVAGSIQEGPAGPLQALFQNFEQNFDGLNLMLYSNDQYYLDADNETWGLKQWFSYFDPTTHPEALKMIHIGFYDSIPYENPDASAGEKYAIPPGSSRGEAAAWVYKYVLQECGYTPDQLGIPFWWTDNPNELPSNQTIQDFWNSL